MNRQTVVDGKRILITGGTGSIGKVLARRLLSGEMGNPAKIIVFSRDEAKQHYMRLEHRKRNSPKNGLLSAKSPDVLEFRIGDVRSYSSIVSALRDADIVVNAAAMKQ